MSRCRRGSDTNPDTTRHAVCTRCTAVLVQTPDGCESVGRDGAAVALLHILAVLATEAPVHDVWSHAHDLVQQLEEQQIRNVRLLIAAAALTAAAASAAGPTTAALLFLMVIAPVRPLGVLCTQRVVVGHFLFKCYKRTRYASL